MQTAMRVKYKLILDFQILILKFMDFLKQLFQTHSQWEASGKFFVVVLVLLNSGVFNGFCLSREFCFVMLVL